MLRSNDDAYDTYDVIKEYAQGGAQLLYNRSLASLLCPPRQPLGIQRHRTHIAHRTHNAHIGGAAGKSYDTIYYTTGYDTD